MAEIGEPERIVRRERTPVPATTEPVVAPVVEPEPEKVPA
jgi:hypothetical protein